MKAGTIWQSGHDGLRKSVATKTAWVNELRVSVLDCGSPLPLFHRKAGDAKRQRAAAVQNLAEFSDRASESGHSFI